jgi:hypothetical protein
MENSQTPKFNKLFKTQSDVIGLITKLISNNLSLERFDLDMLKVSIDMLVVKDPSNEFYYTLLEEVKKIQPIEEEKQIIYEPSTEIINNVIELKPEERRVIKIEKEVEKPKNEIITKLKHGGTFIEKNQNIKPEIEKPKEEPKKSLSKKEIDDKIKALEAKNTKWSYCPKDLDEIERLYKIKNKDREDKFKKNPKNGNIVETEEQKQLLDKYNELDKKRWIQGDWEGNKIREAEVREIQEKLKFQKSIFVEDKQYNIYNYSGKNSNRLRRCIIISDTEKYFKILPIERELTHFDEHQTSHYKFEYPIIIREDKIIKYHKNNYMTKVLYYEKDTEYSMCD